MLPILSRIEKARPLPNSIAEDVLRKTGKTPVSAVIALVAGGMLLMGGMNNARAADGHAPTPPSLKWSFAGPLGKFDQGQLQRGLKVYKEVCSACHGLSFVAFRNLADPGGPGYSAAQAAAFAAEYKVKDGPDDKGEMFERNGRPADYFPSPYPNEQAARASNGGAYPPDLSLIARPVVMNVASRSSSSMPSPSSGEGPELYRCASSGLRRQGSRWLRPAGKGSYYNRFFPGHAIKMPKPISDGQVTFDDGSPATVQQYAKDVSAFLMWAAEPHLEARKRTGLQVCCSCSCSGPVVFHQEEGLGRRSLTAS